MTVALDHWDSLLRRLQCVVCARGFPCDCDGRPELNHIAEGSGKRHEAAKAPLCACHHRGGAPGAPKGAGLHGIGSKAFCRLYRPPGDCEWGLMVWMVEDLARLLYADLKRKKAPASPQGETGEKSARDRREGGGPSAEGDRIRSTRPGGPSTA